MIRNVLRNPLRLRFRPILFVADDGRRSVKGFALALHSAAPNFIYLDFISAARDETGRGAYALVRPPGHHAERRAFGGFCYFNSTAVVAHHLSRWGRVAILDVDYHHGNGTQDIFYRRSDVLTISIHGHPRFAMIGRIRLPIFSGLHAGAWEI
jgi:hypothetical protein